MTDSNKELGLEDFRKIVFNAGSGNSKKSEYGGQTVEDGVYIYQHIKEYPEYLHWFYEQNFSFDLTMGIGVAAGGEVKLFRDYIPCKRTITIDDKSMGNHLDQTIEGKDHFEEWHRIKKLIKTDELIEYEVNSTDVELKEELVEKYYDQLEFAFVDGDHSYDGVRNDIEVVRSIAKDGCIVTFHDVVMIGDCAKIDQELKAGDMEYTRGFKHLHTVSGKCGLSIYRFDSSTKAPFSRSFSL